MAILHYQKGQLFANNVSINELAKHYGTPVYVYSAQYIKSQFFKYDQALTHRKHLICYAVKTNSNLAILSLLVKLGAGFDIVSGGELERVLKAGAKAEKIVFSGVAKSVDEIRRALAVGIKCFNVESEAELLRINDIAQSMGKVAPISLRINPDVDAKTHPYISTGLKENKFGISYSLAFDIYLKAQQLSHLKIVGIDCHIGSQLTEISPFVDAADRLLALVDRLQATGIIIEHIDFGGGLGVTYDDEQPPEIKDLLTALVSKLINYPNVELIVEPGRSIIANAGFLITKVEYIKHQEGNYFAIVDAGMNDLIRPALYQAWMKIIPEQEATPTEQVYNYQVVGPICESSDVLAFNRPLAIKQGDLLVIASAGAYGFSMASNYNSRPRPAEVLINDDKHQLIRKRESFEDLWRGEIIVEC